MNFGKQTSNAARQTALAALVLVIVTLKLYWPATTFDFIQFDDGPYVFQNPHVAGGLSFAGLKWALTNSYAANWHPLTWASHMLDCSIFGLFAGGHHLTNIILHTLNTLLLFVLLHRATKLRGPSFVVAALFGWHPVHVESVAWVAERKDVLSTLFLLLTLLAYVRYTVESTARSPRRKYFYALTLLVFIFGLMSKPMLVTLPCVLLLLDYWPLKRITGDKSASWKILTLEKIPFFALALAACVITVIAQEGAVRTVADVPYNLRLTNALSAYAHYIGKTFWPMNLSIYYLLPAQAAAAPAICAALVLAGATVFFYCRRSQFPWLLVGWLWFLGTLVPVIGLVQVGSQAMADRYTYIPLIGFFFAVVWSFDRILGTTRIGQMFNWSLAAIVLIACVGLTYRQVAFWHNDVTLFQHATEVTPDNYFAQFEYGLALSKAGKTDEAIDRYVASLRINPVYEPAHYRVGLELASVRRFDEAAFHFAEALKRDPNSEELHNDLGAVLAQQPGKSASAITELKRAMQLNPGYSEPYVNYGNLLLKLDQPAAALTNYSRANELSPDSPTVLDKIASLLATCDDAKVRNPTAALPFARRANELTQNQVPDYLATLASAYAAMGNFSDAISTATAALSRAQELKLPDLAAKLERDLAAYRLGKPAPTPPEP